MTALCIFAVTYVLISVQRIRFLDLDRPSAAMLGAVAMVVCGALTLREAYAAVESMRAKELESQLEEFKKGLASPDEKEKLHTIDAIGKSKNGKATSMVLSYLQSRNAELRAAACKALGELKSPGAVAGLGEVLKNKNETPEVQVLAANALGAIGDAKAVPYLLQDLFTVKDERPVFARIEALGKIRDRTAIEALLEVPGQIRGKPIKETKALVFKELEGLTGQKLGDINAWRTWWSKNKDAFKFPKE